MFWIFYWFLKNLVNTNQRENSKNIIHQDKGKEKNKCNPFEDCFILQATGIVAIAGFTAIRIAKRYDFLYDL